MKQANREAFSRVLADVLMEFRDAVLRSDKLGANLYYATALGLISGATLSGGLSRAYGQELLATLEKARSTFTTAFGDTPGAPNTHLD